MNNQINARLKWVKLYELKKDAGYVCRHCGVSRPTLRKWYKRYLKMGIEGLEDQSKRPLSSPNKKINNQIEKWIIDFRIKRNLGARRIQTELMRLHEYHLSLASIHKVLTAHQANLLKNFVAKTSINDIPDQSLETESKLIHVK